MATDNSKKPLTPEEELARRSRRSFLTLAVGGTAAVAGWYWLNGQPLDPNVLLDGRAFERALRV